MNSKQIAVIILMVIGIVLIVKFTPRYKITKIDSENFIKTEQSSSLYKRTKGTEKLHWDRVILYSGLTAIGSGALIFALRNRHG